MEPVAKSLKPSVFAYTDFRAFFRDFYSYNKELNPHLSYPIICEKIGIKSKGHLTLILQGKANISLSLALKIARYFKLKKGETEFFQYMVMYNQANQHKEKKEYFEKMLSFKQSAVSIVSADQYEYYDKWYHPVIRALLEIVNIKEDFSSLTTIITPSLSLSQVNKSMELLLKLKMIERDNQGYYRPATNMIDSGTAPQAISINNTALQTLALARESIDRFPAHERFHTGMTLGLSRKAYHALEEELREFRSRVYKIVETDRAEKVVQLNISLFPVGGVKGKK